MNAQLIDGRKLQAKLVHETREVLSKSGVVPRAALIGIGNSVLMQHNLQLHTKVFRQAGIETTSVNLKETDDLAKMVKSVENLNEDPEIDVILALAPTPEQVPLSTIINAISSAKEAEGLKPEYTAQLSPFAEGFPRRLPLTPLTLFALLKENGLELQGSELVMLSDEYVLQTNPVAKLAVRYGLLPAAPEKMSVQLVPYGHPRQQEMCRNADILLISLNEARVVTGDWVKPGAYCIDFNSIPVEDQFGRVTIAGGMATDSVSQVAGAIAPIPGGFGPALLGMLVRRIAEIKLENVESMRP